MTVRLTIPATYQPPTGSIGDKLAIVAEYLQLRTITNPEALNGYWINVHSDRWMELIGKYADAIRYAERDLIEINHRFSDGSKTDAFSKSYRLKPQHRHTRSRLFELTTKPMQKRYTQTRASDPENLGAAGCHLESKFAEFTLDQTEIAKINSHSFWHLWAVNRFFNRADFAFRCRYGRFHSLYTQMSKQTRACLRANGQQLSELDISSCQPLIIGTQAGTRHNQRTPRKPSSIICRQFFRNSDIEKWIELCEIGGFYIYLWEAIRDQPEPAIARITKTNGQTIHVDLRECSLRSFKRCCLIPLYASNADMLASPVFQLIQREFPTVAKYIIDAKRGQYQALARMSQGIESALMIDGVCGQFAKRHPEIPIATVHDALILPSGNESLGTDLIKSQFEPFGVTPSVKVATFCGNSE